MGSDILGYIGNSVYNVQKYTACRDSGEKAIGSNWSIGKLEIYPYGFPDMFSNG